MKHFTYIALVFMTMGIGGCVSDIPITQPTVIASTRPALNRDQTLGQRGVIIRSYANVEGKRTEVAGARCSLRSNEFSANVTTPGGVAIPMLIQGSRFANRGKPTPLTVTCEGNELRKTITVDAVPLLASGGNTTTSSSSGATVSVSTSVISSATAASKPWTFPNISVELQ